MSTRFASVGGTVALCLWMVGVPIESRAEITRLVIASREPAYEAVAFDAVGAYEWLIGHAEGVLDPRDRHNAAIVNLDKAPRNARGLVGSRMDVQILKPVDVSRGNGRLFYDVVNRGDKRTLGTRVDGGPERQRPTSSLGPRHRFPAAPRLRAGVERLADRPHRPATAGCARRSRSR